MDISTQARAGLGEAGQIFSPLAPSRTVPRAEEAASFAKYPDESKVERQLNKQEFGLAISRVQEFAQSLQRDLIFSVDDASGRIIVEVKDSATGEIIRQIPSEDALRMLDHLEQARSLLFHATA